MVLLLNSADVKNSFHIKSMNVVSPLNELSGDSSGLKPPNILKLKLLVLKMNFVHGDFILCFLLGQIYTEDILLLDALLCHVW